MKNKKICIFVISGGAVYDEALQRSRNTAPTNSPSSIAFNHYLTKLSWQFDRNGSNENLIAGHTTDYMCSYSSLNKFLRVSQVF